MKTYDINKSLNEILNYKDMYNKSKQNGDAQGMKSAADNAKKYYQQLNSYGRNDMANKLAASDYNEASGIVKNYAKKGNTEFRPYMYSLGEKYGLSKNDIDNQIKFDNDTGEISFGGQKIGNPTAISDGKSYFDDTSKLNKAFSDYVDKSGKTWSNDTVYGQNMQNATQNLQDTYNTKSNRSNELWGYVKSDPFETKAADAIREIYGIKGDNASRNSIASGASENGGNIDSFAQANANRWRAYYNSLANQNIMDYKKNNVADMRNVINDDVANALNITNQQMAAAQEAENTRQNEFQRNYNKAQLMGYWNDMMNTGGTMSYNNTYLNDNGTLKDPSIDYQAIEDNLQTKLNNPSISDSERRSLIKQINDVREARQIKVNNVDGYQKYLNTLLYPTETREQTAAERQAEFDRQQTALNNDVNREKEKSAVTGLAPVKWNNSYLDIGLTKGVDYITLGEALEKSGNTNAARQAYVAAWAMYNQDPSSVELSRLLQHPISAHENETVRQFNEQARQADEALKADSDYKNNALNADIEKQKIASNASVEAEKIAGENALKLSDKQTDNALRLAEKGINTNSDGETKNSETGAVSNDTLPDTAVDKEWDSFYNSFDSKPSIQKFLDDVIKGIYNDAATGEYNRDVLEDRIKNGIINNTKQYDIDVDDAKRILNKFGVSDISWLDNYKNRSFFNSGKGMKKIK